jgi:hypothetical protein
MFIRYISLAIALLLARTAFAQQFVGHTANTYSAIQQVPYNPAWVNSAANGTEVGIFAMSMLAGNNAYSISKDAGGDLEMDVNLFKDRTENRKHVWQNIDILGPAVSFTVKEKHRIGLYTRMRELIRAGNLPYPIFHLIGMQGLPSTAFFRDLDVNRSGFSLHAFGEAGFTYGRELKNDEYHMLRGGATVKYLIGFAAASIYADNFDIVLRNGDTMLSITGEVTPMFSYNMNPYMNSQPFENLGSMMERAGTGGLGLDLGFQYEYHPNGSPNYETPYKYSIAASITDLGSVGYYADSGSGIYNLVGKEKDFATLKKLNNEEVGPYLDRMMKDTIIIRKDAVQQFRMGLPTALRINTDWVANTNFNIAVNAMLNLKGNGGNIYRPAYIGYLNVTPTYGTRRYSVSMPCTFYGKQTLTVGAAFRYGPFYIGSSSAISNILPKKLRNADFYMGLMLKFKKDKFII